MVGTGSNKEALFDQRGKKKKKEQPERSRPDMKKNLPVLRHERLDENSKLVPIPDGRVH